MIRDDSTSRGGFGQIFLDLSDSYNISIANENIDLPAITDESEEERRKRLKPLVEEIWETEVRVLILMVSETYSIPVLEMFVDLGAKYGDLIIIGSKSLASLESNGKATDEVEAWEALYVGALQARQSYRTGEAGDWYKSEFKNHFPKSEFTDSTCFYYDAAHVIMRATSFLLTLGKDFEDGE
jgi:hypothetical protein